MAVPIRKFACHEKMTAALDAVVYSADSYSSWQRGSNENANGLLRQYWQKKTDFKKASQKKVSCVIVALNNRSRKKHNYQTPTSKMAEPVAALAA